MAELAGRDRSLRNRQPYKAAVEQDYRWLGDAVVKHYHGDDASLRLLKAAESAFEGMGVEAFSAEVIATSCARSRAASTVSRRSG